jgi:aconitate hydratase
MAGTLSVRSEITVDDKKYSLYKLDQVLDQGQLRRLPFSLKVLLENLLRKADGKNVTKKDIHALCEWKPKDKSDYQISFTPARVILQDFTGVPAVVDLAAMRAAMRQLKGDPLLINPLSAVDLVIDHSVMVDYYAIPEALEKNTGIEFQRNNERYQFLRWGQQAFSNFRVVPPGTGIVHQVNLEYLSTVIATAQVDDEVILLPDTLVGTDSHTTMINGLGVLGWGVGGIEAEAAMLGQPITMLIPQVVGFELKGKLPEGSTATDLVLTVTQMLRAKDVVGKFVEFYGEGLNELPLADRATIANMSPEYGATCGIFPIDEETLSYMRLTGRDEHQIKLVEAYAKAQGMWRSEGEKPAEYSDQLALDLGDVVPSIAGPKRPQDKIELTDAKKNFAEALSQEMKARSKNIATSAATEFGSEGAAKINAVKRDHAHTDASVTKPGAVEFELDGEKQLLKHGAVVIAAITSCTNTSNPVVMVAAGLVAKKALEKGLQVKPWVKTSFAPGSQVVPAYLEAAGLMEPLNQLGFNLVGFGCTTCIGNSGPLREPIKQAIHEGDLVVSSVLSGNRNFEGRIHSEVRTNYLASPPLVVAYALAGSMDHDLLAESLGTASDGSEVFLKDIWPSQKEIQSLIEKTVSADLFKQKYSDVFSGTDDWKKMKVSSEKIYDWPDSTYVKHPPYFEDMTVELPSIPGIKSARCLVKVGDSITTDHISPAGAISADSPAGEYLKANGVEIADFNSYGSRRGNHEVMVRGTFANVRLKNQLAPGTEGGWTTYLPENKQMSIFEASTRYQKNNVPLIVLAGKEYGTGSSRDWAAKGTNLLGVKAVIAGSYERIHRSNLVGFGVLPLEFSGGDSVESLGLTGEEMFDFEDISGEPTTLKVSAKSRKGKETTFPVKVRIDTAVEWDYYRHGGILHYVLRDLLKGMAK